MKRIISILVCVMVIAFYGNVMAASSIVSTSYGQSNQGNMVLIKSVCTAHTDGLFTDTYPSGKTITAAEVGFEYSKAGYYLAHAWVVNSATDDHTNASVVTITDATGQVIIGAASGDTLSLSQAASGIAYLSAARSAAQRAVTSNLTIAIADTGDSATVQTIYLLLVR